MRVFVDEAVKGAERKMRMIASLPDAHVALTLLKFCAGFVSVVHLMRAVGAVFDFACIDQATQSCLATITGIETDASAWALASLPVRLGGLGLHSCADTAAIAHIAATFDGEACLPSLVTPYVLPHAMLLDEDDTFLASLDDPRLAPFETVLEKIQNALQARDNYGGRGRKVWSATVHDERRKALIISMTEELGSCGYPPRSSRWPSGSGWGCPSPPCRASVAFAGQARQTLTECMRGAASPAAAGRECTMHSATSSLTSPAVACWPRRSSAPCFRTRSGSARTSAMSGTAPPLC
ncbi:hypothetical protein DIPPA_01200 [Diplonema papillatum]|nr:hypothetical protein DIPPA_01200 [Diplonema papillatum]